MSAPATVLAHAIEEYRPQAVLGLFSGGNDSTVMMHAVRTQLDYACHINTGIGIEQTREFVRQTCAAWGLPLIEERSPEQYEDLVLRYGFPGPHGHRFMYSWLKERPLRQVRRRFVQQRDQRVMFVTGVRRHESQRRFEAGYSAISRAGSVVWVNPIFDWTTDDLNEYRRAHDVPRNEVADLLHMSGECLCGAFAHPGELDEIALWFPEVAERIRSLEHRAELAGVHCRWGTRPPKAEIDGQSDLLGVGPLCSSCVARGEPEGATAS